MRWVLFAVIAVLPTLTFAAGKEMKPGLWEMTMKSDALRDMPEIPPEQMAKIKEMGIEMPQMKNGAMTTRQCITEEMARRDHRPEIGREQAGCKVTNHKQSGNSYQVDLACDGPDLKGKGAIKGNFSAGGDRFQSVYDFSGSSRGKPVTQHHEVEGRYLGRDCGNVKPVDEMADEFRKRKKKQP